MLCSVYKNCDKIEKVLKHWLEKLLKGQEEFYGLK